MMPQDDLDRLFDTARGQRMAASDALLARVMQDALTHQPQLAAPVISAPVARRGLWATLAAALGGAGALAAIGSAAAAGVVIGFAEPQTLGVLTASYYDDALDSVEMIPSVDTLLVTE